ncbi:MAG: hypothetical protein QOI91_2670 [Solirubrobacteraceae bacterium]|nr:hypothetical protein [Solirubrobacteraceae bacterium]
MAGAIAVYGATGYTGRLVVAELARRGIQTAVSGRNPSRLRAVSEAHGGGPEVRPASLDDRDALRHALGDCAAVINCAGPFTRLGEPVVRAAVETGTHYVDTTGEQTHMRRVYERFDDAAQAAEVALVPAAGFDYVPGDLISRLAARDVEPLSELVVAYAVSGFGATRGTLHSALEMVRSGGFEYRDGALRPAGGGPRRARFAFPEPVGSQAMAPYPSGEVLSVPRHTRTRNVVSLISASAFAAPGVPGELVALTMPAAGLAMRTPLKTVVDLIVDRLPEGPAEADRRASRFTIVAVARGEDGRTGHGLVRGGDVYGLTAVTAVHSAALLAEGSFSGPGAHSPASAFDPVEFLDHLGDHGVTYETSAAVREAAV